MIEREKYEPPADAINALARCLYPAMVAYFESDDGQRELFAEWQAAQGKATTPAEGAMNRLPNDNTKGRSDDDRPLVIFFLLLVVLKSS